MIQIKRGSTQNWITNSEKLADGQPAYDKTRNKLKIGNGSKTFNELPDVSGLSKNEILSEYTPRNTSGLSALEQLLDQLLNPDPIFTYGTKKPTEVDKGEIYFQKYDGAVEADYVVEYGKHANCYFRKWVTGFMECWGTGDADLLKTLKADLGFTSVIYETKTGNYFEIKGYWKE